MEFIKEESEDVKIEETFRVKHEDVKIEETFRVKHEDVKIEETFSVKHEDTEEQTDLMRLKEESKVLNKWEEKEQSEKHHDFKTGENSFSCPRTENTSSRERARSSVPFFQCPESFTGHANLTVMRVHTGERPFICQQCEIGFTHKGNLIRHMKIHTGEKPYTCKLCGKSFTRNGILKNHMSVHTGEKPYVCHHCGKCFNHKGNFSNHKRTHFGEKPDTCPQCGKSFDQHVSLKGDLLCKIHL
ncbi:unnamed protein product [Leuciscus chuanchicus]